MSDEPSPKRRRLSLPRVAFAAALAAVLGVLLGRQFGTLFAFPAEAKAPPAPLFSPVQEQAAEATATMMVRRARQEHPCDPERLPGYDQANVLYNTAYRWEQQGRHDMAVADYTEAIHCTPQWGELYDQIGWCLKNGGRLGEAEAAERQAVRLSGTDWSAFYSEGDMLLEMRRYEEALPYYLTCTRLARPHTPDLFWVYRRLDGVYEELGGYPWAARADRQWLRLRPDDPEAHNALAYNDSRLGDQAGSARECRIVLRLTPNDVQATDNLGDALALLGHTAEARREWEQVLRLSPSGVFADDARQMLDKSP